VILTAEPSLRQRVPPPVPSPSSDLNPLEQPHAPRAAAQVHELARIFDAIKPDLERVDREFEQQIQSRVDVIPQIGRYIQRSGGKRVRPAVLLMAARLCGYHGERAVTYAAVVEFIHTATLVHDDIIDDSDLRRGRLCDVTLRMIEGELYQLTKTGDVDIREEEHFDIIRRKTAYLFGGCAEIGALLGGVDAERQAALREYGFNLGIAFQLTDDLLDFTADQTSLGKPIGGDLREGKITLPIIYLLQRSPEADALVRTVVKERSVTPDAWRELTRLLADHRALDDVYDKALSYAEAAKKCLDVFAPSPDRDALLALPDYVLSRDR
jgi:octaprenyl-diphosphate synthase